MSRLSEALSVLPALSTTVLRGSVRGAGSLGVEIGGLDRHLAVGDRVTLHTRAGPVAAEITGIRGGFSQAAAFADTAGIGVGDLVTASVGPGVPSGATLAPGPAWLGRVLDPLGHPLDGGPPPAAGLIHRRVRASPPAATQRGRLGPALDLGVRALNLFTTCRAGQRLGLFAGSGIGKSTLLAMLARHTACDVAVVALVGERGREVREFVEDELGPEGLARSVVLAATSDAPPLLRRECAYAALTVAEHFAEAGRSVLLLMDSVTRFALALRELGLAAGEPPATRGYPPSVFAELPRLLERAGPARMAPDGTAGTITALFTVLVEGGDHDEPIADAVRGILDGHVVLDRRIAEAGRYPAVDILRSLSRAASGVLAPERAALLRAARAHLATHADMADMVRLGAYRAGTDPAVDAALQAAPRIEALLTQDRHDPTSLDACFTRLAEALGGG